MRVAIVIESQKKTLGSKTITQNTTRARLFRLRLTYARNPAAETSLHRPAHRTYPNEGGPIGCTARKGGTPYTTFTLPA